MERQGEEVHVTSEEASAGAPPQGVRYVLAISLILVIAALSAVWIFGALQTTRYPAPAAVKEASPAPAPSSTRG